MKNDLTQRQKALKIKRLIGINPFYKFYANAIDSLNNDFFITQIARQGLQEIREECKKKDASVKYSIPVPSTTGITIKQEHRKSHIVEILKHSIKKDLFAASVGNCVSITEQYLCDIIQIILKKYPHKITEDIVSNNAQKTDKKIEIKKIISATSLDEIINNLIKQKISTLFYASPEEYFTYLKEVIGINFDELTIKNYIEIKATRDLLVHNKGKVNDIYINKCKDAARVTDTKQNIPITEQYYIQSISVIKKIVRGIHEQVSKTHLKLTNKRDIFLEL